MLDPAIVWAALDCPSFPPARILAGVPHVLGRLSVELIAPVPATEPAVVVGWELGNEGRKLHSASAVLSPEGELLARSEGALDLDPTAGSRSSVSSRLTSAE
jgi:hypothetical protein